MASNIITITIFLSKLFTQIKQSEIIIMSHKEIQRYLLVFLTKMGFATPRTHITTKEWLSLQNI